MYPFLPAQTPWYSEYHLVYLDLPCLATYVVDVHRGWSNVDGADNVDTIWALFYRFEDGKIAEAINFSGDQDAANAFFWSAYKLKPIPQRLAE